MLISRTELSCVDDWTASYIGISQNHMQKPNVLRDVLEVQVETAETQFAERSAWQTDGFERGRSVQNREICSIFTTPDDKFGTMTLPCVMRSGMPTSGSAVLHEGHRTPVHPRKGTLHITLVPACHCEGELTDHDRHCLIV